MKNLTFTLKTLTLAMVLGMILACGGGGGSDNSETSAKSETKLPAKSKDTPEKEVPKDSGVPPTTVDSDGGDNITGTAQGTPQNEPQSQNDQKPSAGQKTGASCLTDTCTARVPPALDLQFDSLNYFDPSTTQCQLANDSVILKSSSTGRLVVIYRAKYSSLGRWQLYAQQVSLENGIKPALRGNRVNLLPTCDGNVAGVTSFSVTGGTPRGSSTGLRAFSVDEMEDLATVTIKITCVNSFQSRTLNLDLDSLVEVAGATLPLLSSRGAVAYWSAKDLYIMADGSTLKGDGLAANTWLPQMPSLAASGLPRDITDYTSTTVSLASNRTTPSTLFKLRLQVVHPNPTELRAYIVSPSGSYFDIALDANSVRNGLNQEYTLSMTSRQNPGDWKLTIMDSSTRNVGSLQRFEIQETTKFSRSMGEYQGGIYLELNTGEMVFISDNLSRTQLDWSSAVASGFSDAQYGFYLVSQTELLSHNISRWSGEALVSVSQPLGYLSLGPTAARATVYGRYSDCSWDSTARFFGNILRSCSSQSWSWQSKVRMISKGSKKLIWRATAGRELVYISGVETNYRSCRDSSNLFVCELSSFDLSNGTLNATVENRTALDFYNNDRGFLGSKWILERNEGNKGLIFISNNFFN